MLRWFQSLFLFLSWPSWYTTFEYLGRSSQDHLFPLGTCCVPAEQNNEETNFLFCQNYVNHVIRKHSSWGKKGKFHFKEILKLQSFYSLWLPSILNEDLPGCLDMLLPTIQFIPAPFVIFALAIGNSSRFLLSTLISHNQTQIKEAKKAIFLSDVTFTLNPWKWKGDEWKWILMINNSRW